PNSAMPRIRSSWLIGGAAPVRSRGRLDTLLAGVDAERPDVVLTDIRMPPTYSDEGIRAADRLADSAPGLGVVVLSQHLDPGTRCGCSPAAVPGRGYLLKERLGDITVLVNALRAVAAGGSVVGPKVGDVLVRPGRRRRWTG